MAKAINFRFLFFLIFAFLFVYVLFFLSSENLKISKRRAILENEMQRLQAKTINLSSQENFSVDDYLEKVAREDLNLKKEGEQSVVVQLPDISSFQKKDFSKQEEKGFLEKIWAKVAQW